MKVGIITISYGLNYGQRLQNYAVEQVLISLGLKPETILLHPESILSCKARIILKMNVLLKRGNWKTGFRPVKFDTFNKRYIHFSKELFPNGNFQKYDYVVCGSDQIWNINDKEIEDNIHYYFADFFDSEKRIAYSASTGTVDFDNRKLEILRNKINGFKNVSFREKISADVFNRITDKKSIATIDPVFMLDAKQWNRIAQKPKFINKHENFLVTYFLGKTDKNLTDYINLISKTTGIRVIPLCGDFLKNEEDYLFHSVDPSEFLWLLSNCTAVYTDSFHGCAFSCIFGKPFRWFSRSDGASMNCRIDNLFSVLSVDKRAIGSLSEKAEDTMMIDYSDFEIKLEKERTKAVEYLKNALLL